MRCFTSSLTKIILLLEIALNCFIWLWWGLAGTWKPNCCFLERSCNYLWAFSLTWLRWKTNPEEPRPKHTPAKMHRVCTNPHTHTHTEACTATYTQVCTQIHVITPTQKPRGPQLNWTFPPILQPFFPPSPFLISRELEVAKKETEKLKRGLRKENKVKGKRTKWKKAELKIQWKEKKTGGGGRGSGGVRWLI